jgi:hypothetical protein
MTLTTVTSIAISIAVAHALWKRVLQWSDHTEQTRLWMHLWRKSPNNKDQEFNVVPHGER